MRMSGKNIIVHGLAGDEKSIATIVAIHNIASSNSNDCINNGVNNENNEHKQASTIQHAFPT